MHSKANKKPDFPPTAVVSCSRKRPSDQPQQMCDESKSKSRNSKKPGLFKSHSDISTLTNIERERKMSRSERHRKVSFTGLSFFFFFLTISVHTD